MSNKWILGARPKTLPAAIAPIMVASALAGSQFSLLPALLALLVSLSLQVGVNYANDYSDGVRGTDENRIGPVRITASGLATPTQVKRAAFIAFGCAAICGLMLALLTSWVLILVGLISILAAWGYTGGKNPYGYNGLGELSVFIFFGVIATVGTYYVQTEELTLEAFIASIPVGALACALLAANNIRDRAQDALVGKRTVAVRLGDRNSRIAFAAILALAHLAALLIARPGTLLTLLVAPLSISIARAVMGPLQGSALIPFIAKTGKLQLIFSLAFSFGLLI